MPLTPWLSHYKTDFELARRRRGESIQFDDLRCEAFDRFLLLGFPTANDESWRSIDVTPLAETCFTMGAKPADGERDATVADLSLRDACVELVFANGYLMAARSRTSALPNGAIAAPLASLLASNADELAAFFARVAAHRSFPARRAQHRALRRQRRDPGAAALAIEAPIHVRFISTGEADATPAMSQPRVLVVLGEESLCHRRRELCGPGRRALLHECGHRGRARQRRLARSLHGAGREHRGISHGRHARDCWHRRQLQVERGRPWWRVHPRREIVTLAGERATCTLNGFYVADGNRLLNTHALIDHAAPGCVSRRRHTRHPRRPGTRRVQQEQRLRRVAEDAHAARRSRVAVAEARGWRRHYPWPSSRSRTTILPRAPA